MALLEFQATGFRNLADERTAFSPGLNLIHGANGSGKTSLLEGIHYLGLGRSFRTHKHESVVCHDSEEFTLFGRVEDEDGECRLGLSRNTRERVTRLRFNGGNAKNLSTLAQRLPISVIDSGAFDLVGGGPMARRQYVDWGVFHVEHRFGQEWQVLQKSLSQRNQLLRHDKIDAALKRVWDEHYTRIAEAVTARRHQCLATLVPLLCELLDQTGLPWAREFEVDFFQGWDRRRSLADLLKEHEPQERNVGHTLYGPNRADLRFRVGGRPAGEVLSRGQQKTLVVLLKLAQGRLLRQEKNRQSVFLIDDMGAELDEENQALIASLCLELGSQLFVTSIEKEDLRTLWKAVPDSQIGMFHVEHGRLKRE